jgi:hypothetical protein
MIRKFGILAGMACICVGVRAGQVTLNITAGELRYDAATPMPDTGLLLLGASTSDGTFNDPIPGAFFSGDDIEVFRWDLTAAHGNSIDTTTFPGTFDGSTGALTLESFPGWTTGDPLRLYWYPTKTFSDTAPGAGTRYGMYPLDGSWTTPGAGSTVSFQFLTTSRGGPEPDAAGYASNTVVPEPSTYAAAFGAACLGFGLLRKRLTARQ